MNFDIFKKGKKKIDVEIKGTALYNGTKEVEITNDNILDINMAWMHGKMTLILSIEINGVAWSVHSDMIKHLTIFYNRD